MALFKILKGDSSRISTDVTPFHDGYALTTTVCKPGTELTQKVLGRVHLFLLRYFLADGLLANKRYRLMEFLRTPTALLVYLNLFQMQKWKQLKVQSFMYVDRAPGQ